VCSKCIYIREKGGRGFALTDESEMTRGKDDGIFQSRGMNVRGVAREHDKVRVIRNG
jgi:hypothetical protein